MKALMFLLLLVSLSFAVFYGSDYPEELKLFETFKIGQDRPIVDVEYYFDGKEVVGKLINNIEGTNINETWFEINTGDGRVATCMVSGKAYSQYEIGDTIGITKREREIVKEEIKSEIKDGTSIQKKGEDRQGKEMLESLKIFFTIIFIVVVFLFIYLIFAILIG